MDNNVLKGKKWEQFLINNQFTNRLQMELYRCTHNHEAIYFLNGYFFSFSICRGYKNISSLKRLLCN